MKIVTQSQILSGMVEEEKNIIPWVELLKDRVSPILLITIYTLWAVVGLSKVFGRKLTMIVLYLPVSLVSILCATTEIQKRRCDA